MASLFFSNQGRPKVSGLKKTASHRTHSRQRKDELGDLPVAEGVSLPDPGIWIEEEEDLAQRRGGTMNRNHEIPEKHERGEDRLGEDTSPYLGLWVRCG